MRPITRSITVPVSIPANAGAQGNSIRFPDVPELRETGVRCYGFQVYDNTATAFWKDGTPVITPADSTAVLVTLVEASNQRIKELPWSIFSPITNFGAWFETVPFLWQPQQSSVAFTSATAVTAAFTIPFVVHYSQIGDPQA